MVMHRLCSHNHAKKVESLIFSSIWSWNSVAFLLVYFLWISHLPNSVIVFHIPTRICSFWWHFFELTKSVKEFERENTWSIHRLINLKLMKTEYQYPKFWCGLLILFSPNFLHRGRKLLLKLWKALWRLWINLCH